MLSVFVLEQLSRAGISNKNDRTRIDNRKRKWVLECMYDKYKETYETQKKEH